MGRPVLLLGAGSDVTRIQRVMKQSQAKFRSVIRSVIRLNRPTRRIACWTVILLLGLPQNLHQVQASAVYYVSCTGSDSNAGTSPSMPWATFNEVSTTALKAGDQVLLQSDCIWKDMMLSIGSSGTSQANITISAYGTGNLPEIDSDQSFLWPVELSGSYITLEHIHVHGIPPSLDNACSSATATGIGDITGVDVTGSYNTIQYVTADGFNAGLTVRQSGSHNEIIHDTFNNNTLMVVDTPTFVSNGDDYGAVGVLLIGDNNDIAYNSMSGNVACSYDFGTDGASVEVYGGRNNTVHHNKSYNSATFTELGNSRSASNRFYDNLHSSSIYGGTFLSTHGPQSPDGPVYGTLAYNNTSYLSGRNTTSIYCGEGCTSSMLTLENNILWGYRGFLADGLFIEDHNLYWVPGGTPAMSFPISPTSRIVDPLFVNAGVDFHLQSISPAIAAGTAVGLTSDLDGNPVAAVPVIGAYEYQTASFSTPAALAPSQTGVNATSTPPSMVTPTDIAVPPAPTATTS